VATITDEKARDAIRGWIDQQFAELDRSSYYHLLQVAQNAPGEQVRDAYYRMVARLHPDLYVDSLDRGTRDKLVSIYSRMVEGYRVLSDGRRRELYDKSLAQGKLRFTQDEERAPRRDAVDELTNANAKRFFKLGMEAMRGGDGKSAVMNFKFALSQEPQSALIKTELQRAEELVRKGQGS
jgi:DnaJ-class molecular chaperone